ncbi:UNVERIFIED_CONTAM: hypothetical protein GTU68_041871, partial [Idotea baltica]|nr:hypothetical protein [Idotea baltica]
MQPNSPDSNEQSEAESEGEPDTEFRSGFAAIVGRPNVGKSTLLNQILDHKITIVSDKAQTTRHQIRGVLTTEEVQIVFVDTPGISKPRTALGDRLNETADSALSDVDAILFVIDGREGFGKGDRFLAERMNAEKTIVVVNKIDGLDRDKVLAQLATTSELDFSAYYPVSAWTGKGVQPLVAEVASRMPAGPMWYPAEMVT